MLVNLVFFFFLCSGSVYFAIVKEKKFEETLPVTAMGSILLVFVFGVFGFLKEGVFACFVLAALFYLFSAIYVYKHKGFGKGLFSLLTPGFVIFVLAFLVFTYTEYGRIAIIYDEFNHWAYIVKIMAHLDDFGTNPASYSYYPSYPPGMAIFQYIVQKIGHIIGTIDSFSEWHVFFACKIFVIILMLPFFAETSFQKLHHILCLGVACFAAPLVVSRFVYRDIMMDPVMGYLSGVGFATILLSKNKDIFYHLRIWMLLACLILFKDAGKVLAVFLLSAYCVDEIAHGEKNKKQTICFIVCAVIFTVLPILLWKWEMITSQCYIKYSNKIDIPNFIQVLLGRDTSYRAAVAQKYPEALAYNDFQVGHLPIILDFYSVYLIVTVLSLILSWYYAKKESDKTKIIIVMLALLQMVVYVIGLLPTYMYKFPEIEALTLASLERYLKLELASNWIIISLMAAFAVMRWGDKKLCVLFMVGSLLITPVKDIYRLLVRKNADIYLEYRLEVEPIHEKIMELCDGDDKVVFVSNYLSDYLVMFPYITWPNKSYDFTLTEENKVEELQGMIDNGCEYVATFRLNDTFTQYYGELFENTADIQEVALYRVEKATGKLVKCE